MTFCAAGGGGAQRQSVDQRFKHSGAREFRCARRRWPSPPPTATAATTATTTTRAAAAGGDDGGGGRLRLRARGKVAQQQADRGARLRARGRWRSNRSSVSPPTRGVTRSALACVTHRVRGDTSTAAAAAPTNYVHAEFSWPGRWGDPRAVTVKAGRCRHFPKTYGATRSSLESPRPNAARANAHTHPAATPQTVTAASPQFEWISCRQRELPPA